MNLHEHIEEFQDLQEIVAAHVGIPVGAVKRDYYIVKMLEQLEHSSYAEFCVFKGGTSLSKCYPGAIERFSEDIDLTFIPPEDLGRKQYDKHLKNIEATLADGFQLDKIRAERNDRNKSSYVWFDKQDIINGRIKLEIGSSVRPDPYKPMVIKTYIQEYLEERELFDAVAEFELKPISINTLAIERTFLDKVMAVKRHAICGTLGNKVRHIYDVTALFKRDDIQKFLSNVSELKRLIEITKNTDGFYLQKRAIAKEYNPLGKYDFSSWKYCFDDTIRRRYESLHEDLLYTNQKQKFIQAVSTFEQLNHIFESIDE
jgi:predicted nucleotidyltransferase component of viral defense system